MTQHIETAEKAAIRSVLVRYGIGGLMQTTAGMVDEILSSLAALSPESAQADNLCIACAKPLKDGDMVMLDASEAGLIHAECCGPERESYCNADGEPLAEGDPIPTGFAYLPEPAHDMTPVARFTPRLKNTWLKDTRGIPYDYPHTELIIEEKADGEYVSFSEYAGLKSRLDKAVRDAAEAFRIGVAHQEAADKAQSAIAQLEAYLEQKSHLIQAARADRKIYRERCATVEASLAEMQRELDHFTCSGIAEVAVRNPSVMDYMTHWEGRATKAETSLAEAYRDRDIWHRRHDGCLSRLTACQREKEGLRVALTRISAPQSCGCVPCVGQCRSEEALSISIEAMQDIAIAALNSEGA